MGYAELIALLAQLGISVAGENRANDEKDQQRAILSKALAEFSKLTPPQLEQLKAEQQGPSAFEGVHSDPEARAQQLAALDSLSQISSSGGLTLADKANLNRVRNQTAATASAGRGRIADDMASRGTLDSGAQLAMQLAGNEGSANRQSQEDMDIAGQMQKRALDAVLQKGKLAGEIRGQQYGEDSRKAEARDLIARYNTEARSKAQYHNAGLPQQTFDNQMRRAQGMATGGAPLAGFYGGQADDTRQFYAGLGATAARAGKQFDRYQDTQGAKADTSESGQTDDELAKKWGGTY